MELPSRYVVLRTIMVTAVAATISISFSTGLRLFVGAEADAITIAVRLILPFLIAPPIALVWFTKLERLEKSYHDLLAKTNMLVKSASTDPLTGLRNRRSFTEQFDLARSHGVKGMFLLADVDDLKPINDQHGHLIGDDAILATATALSTVLGDEALIARIGGDEFCAFIANHSNSRMDKLIAEINAAARRDFRERSGLADAHLSVSIGYQACDPDQSLRDLVAQSDTRLYRQKRRRRRITTPEDALAKRFHAIPGELQQANSDGLDGTWPREEIDQAFLATHRSA